MIFVSEHVYVTESKERQQTQCDRLSGLFHEVTDIDTAVVFSEDIFFSDASRADAISQFRYRLCGEFSYVFMSVRHDGSVFILMNAEMELLFIHDDCLVD